MIEERLLILLRNRANAQGIVSVGADALAAESGASLDESRGAVERLQRAGLLSVLAPFPFLVLKLRMWSGVRENHAESRRSAYSYSKLSSNRLNESYRQPGDGQLLREILETLGETDPAGFEGAVKNFAPDVIRKALDRVRRTRHLRKSRTALFRYLLSKLS